MKTKLTFLILIIIGFYNQFHSQLKSNDTLKVCTEIKEYNFSGQKISVLKREKWSAGQVLKVKFLGGDNFLQSKVKQYAVEWSKHCSIKLEFITSGTAQIRVNFVAGKVPGQLLERHPKLILSIRKPTSHTFPTMVQQ